jgi:O-acetylserine/cysteine efflux transporter
MTAPHVLLALLVAVIWGLAFVATRLGLDDFSPSELVLLRFIVAAAPALVLPRPRIPVGRLVLIGLTLYTGQFVFQFFGIAAGTPPGLAAVIVQSQALLTVLFAALWLRERPAPRETLGMLAALAGVVAIALSVGDGLTLVGLALVLVSPVSFAVGNVLLKSVGAIDMLSLVVWLSLVPPLPALVLSWAFDGPGGLPRALAHASWTALASSVYLGLVATVLGYALWGVLLRRYPAAMVTPYALLAPLVAAVASAITFGERFGRLRLAGMALVLLGVAIVTVPAGRAPRAA